MLSCNANAFMGTSFGWFCPRPVSLLTWRIVPPLDLLNAGQCELLWRNLALLFFAGEWSGDLPEDNSSFAEVFMLSRMMSSFPLLRAVGCFAWLLFCTSF